MTQLTYLSKYNPDFESQYVALRKKEGRLLNDVLVKLLPDAGFDAKWKKEWAVRKKTSDNFINYLSKHSFKQLLDIGCGNGWFSAKLALVPGLQVTGLDVNKDELEQAIRVFGNTNPEYFYGDIFENIF